MHNPKIDIIVTRNPNLHAFAIELGLATADTPVFERATVEGIKGKHVLGTLSHHLSSRAATYTEIPVRTNSPRSPRKRVEDYSLAELREFAGEPKTYTITTAGGRRTTSRSRWSTIQRAAIERS